jgi:hypothetical protein
MGLGLSGAYGAAEGQLALKRLQAEDLQRQEIAKRDLQQQFANAIELRRIAEAEASGATGREVSMGGLDLSRLRHKDIAVPEAQRQAELHVPQLDAARQNAALGGLRLKRISELPDTAQGQWASGLDFEDIASPEAQVERGKIRGQAAGAGAQAAFDGGGRQVLQGTEDIRLGSDLRRYGVQQAGAMQQIAARSAAELEQIAAGAGARAGRSTTSGDANRIAEFDTSLDDVDVLAETLGSDGSTGTIAKLQAILPNAITESTGIGIGAKQRQAVIDRVKQVIGKALEGGVLRKEDEYKYTKILPTIADAPEVAKSKMDGLRSAIELRRQRTLEALADAGYDTSDFEARRQPAKANAATLGPGEKIAADGKTILVKNAKGQWVPRVPQ